MPERLKVLPFNSIEWIRVEVEDMAAAYADMTFNSIEWILPHRSSSRGPSHGRTWCLAFNSIEWIPL